MPPQSESANRHSSTAQQAVLSEFGDERQSVLCLCSHRCESYAPRTPRPIESGRVRLFLRLFVTLRQLTCTAVWYAHASTKSKIIRDLPMLAPSIALSISFEAERTPHDIVITKHSHTIQPTRITSCCGSRTDTARQNRSGMRTVKGRKHEDESPKWLERSRAVPVRDRLRYHGAATYDQLYGVRKKKKRMQREAAQSRTVDSTQCRRPVQPDKRRQSSTPQYCLSGGRATTASSSVDCRNRADRQSAQMPPAGSRVIGTTGVASNQSAAAPIRLLEVRGRDVAKVTVQPR